MHAPHISNLSGWNMMDPASRNMMPATAEQKEKYQRQMAQMFGNTNAPAVLYKGQEYRQRVV